MQDRKTTGLYDIDGDEIFEGDTLEYKTINNRIVKCIVKWSNFWNKFIGDISGEFDIKGDLLDLKPSYFCKAKKVSV